MRLYAFHYAYERLFSFRYTRYTPRFLSFLALIKAEDKPNKEDSLQ